MAPRRAARRSKKARYGESRDSDTVDRLSGLPDAVLRRVLSRVPIEDAVRASLLSKRWQHLWLSIPKLEFWQGDFRNRSDLMNLVGRALLLRGSFPVEEFTLTCDAKSDMVRINSWIAAVAMRGVRDLCLSIRPGRERFVFPPCLFRCGTLTRLRIFFYEPHDLTMPSSVFLPSLTELILGRVRFVDYGSVQKLLSSCPALESLSIDNCHWTGLDGKTISAPSLQRLNIGDWEAHAGGCCSGKVVIDGPNVKFFSLYSKPGCAYCLVGSSSLDEAKLSFSCRTHCYSDLVGFYDQFQGLHNVRSLTLRLVSGEDEFQGLPVFCNMTRLILDSGHVPLGSKALVALLERSPCLRILEIYQFAFQELDPEVSQALELVPPCFESKLKKIIVHCPCPGEVNLDWIALLLKQATVLEEMVLYYFKSKEGANKLNHLKKLPKGSKDCKILLVQRSNY